MTADALIEVIVAGLNADDAVASYERVEEDELAVEMSDGSQFFVKVEAV